LCFNQPSLLVALVFTTGSKKVVAKFQSKIKNIKNKGTLQAFVAIH